jgi:hypothetical protein
MSEKTLTAINPSDMRLNNALTLRQPIRWRARFLPEDWVQP